MDALLIVDMQEGSFRSAPRLDAEAVIGRINRLSGHFRTQGKPVIFIRHNGTRENFLIPGTPDWEILSGMDLRPGDVIIEKTANDAFYRTGLDAYLKATAIKAFVITGCATDFCVNATLHSALVRDYSVIVAKDAHTTADRPGLSARSLIDFHNWLWENLTPTQGRVTLKTTGEIITRT